MKRNMGCGLVVAGLLALSGEASAQSRDHHGFMVRLNAGVGFLSTNQSQGSFDLSVSGISGAAYVALGGYVAPGLALHATGWNGVAFGPTARFSTGSSSLTRTSSSDSSLTQTAVGVGATYTLPAVDLSFTGSLGLGFLLVSSRSTGVTRSEGTDLGFAFNLGVAKHWAVSQDWGLGVAGLFAFQTNSESSAASAPALTTLAASVMFSAAYH